MNCLILAGGQSLPKILNGRECKKKGWFTIGVNLAGYMIGDWVDICFFADSLMWWLHKDALIKCQARKISLDKNKPGVNSIKEKAINVEIWQWGGCHGINTRPRFCCFNRSSGGAAINLAYHLGAKQILLAGYDMHGDSQGRNRNWYPEQYQKNSKKGYHNMLAAFDGIARDAHKLKLKIINVTPGSMITQFPFSSVEDFKCLS